MIKLKQLSLAAAILVAANSSQAVSLIEGAIPAECEQLKTASCSTIKSNAIKACTKVHKEQADALGANRIKLLSNQVTSQKQRKPSLTGAKMVTLTTVPAEYFLCAKPKMTPPIKSMPPAPGKRITPPQKQKPTNSIEARLIQLNQLLEKGLITKEEYQAKRKDILDSL